MGTERTAARVPIEELIDFPTRYMFKAVGPHTLPFSQAVLEAVQGVLGEGRSVEVRSRLSAQAKYVSITLTTVVESAKELKDTYAALQTVRGVITIL